MNLKKFEEIYERTPKSTILVYVILRILTVACLVRQIMLGSYVNAFLCLLSLVLFALPFLTEDILRLRLPSGLQISIFLFIYSSEVLGEIYNFYGAIPFWDTLLHTINGFLCASVGFNLADLLNKKLDRSKMSPIFLAIIAFCFSMTIGVLWEFFEFGADQLFSKDMQKDRVVQVINSVKINPDGENIPIKVDNIAYTIIYDADGNELQLIEGGYLDIGIIDTMKDLIVNLIGAIVFCVFGFLYVSNSDRYNFVEKFEIQKTEGTDG